MPTHSISIFDKLKSYAFYVIPHHAISRFIFKLTRIESNLKNPLINWFIRQFDVDMGDAEIQDIRRYKHFNAFFTRSLKAKARPICNEDHSIVSPVDGTVSQAGEIISGRIFQAKGQDYSLLELLGGDTPFIDALSNGRFATLYLSPSDYHRIHMPVNGRLRFQRYIPGQLFSVAPHTVKTIPRLFSRNERVLAFFDTDFGPMALILVGAINVAAIETVWSGLITPPNGKQIIEQTYHTADARAMEKGAEMGRFNMGSTVIILFGKNAEWSHGFENAKKIKMGEKIGLFL